MRAIRSPAPLAPAPQLVALGLDDHARDPRRLHAFLTRLSPRLRQAFVALAESQARTASDADRFIAEALGVPASSVPVYRHRLLQHAQKLPRNEDHMRPTETTRPLPLELLHSVAEATGIAVDGAADQQDFRGPIRSKSPRGLTEDQQRITRVMTREEQGDAVLGCSRQLFRAREESRQRLLGLHGDEWFADPCPENRWKGPEGLRRVAEEQQRSMELHARRAAALGTGPFVLKGSRYHAPTLKSGGRVETWVEATYETAEAAIDALDARREYVEAGVMYAIVPAVQVAGVPVEPQEAANEPMVLQSERSAA